ncbi:MAG: M56 family metallopeptidase [Pseudonocardiaceae bacterium]
MIASIVLLAYAALLASVVAPALRAARWVEHAPRWGLAAWLALAWSLVLSVGLAVTTLCLNLPSSATQLHRAITLCLHALGGSSGLPAALLAALSLTALLAGTVRLLHTLTRHWWRTLRQRRAHTRALFLLGRTEPRIGALVLDDHRPAAYCVSGGRGHIVLTTAALDRLTPTQLHSVLAHERAHLRGRHALLVAAGTLPARLLPGLGATQHAARAVARLVEYTADDTASEHTDRLTLAEALLTLGTPTPAPTSTLGATATGTPARITRLLHDEPGRRRTRWSLAAPTAIAGVTIPVLLAVVTAHLGGTWNACLLGLPC